MAYSYTDAKMVNLGQLKKAAVRSQAEIANLAGTVASAIEEVLGVTVKGNLRIFFGSCTTAASTAIKAVTIEGITALAAGDVFIIAFDNAQSYNGIPKLKVNTLTEQNIKRLSGENAQKGEWNAGAVVVMVWNGSAFLLCNGEIATTSYYGKTKLTNDTNSNSETLAASAKAVKTVNDRIDALPEAMFTVVNGKVCAIYDDGEDEEE